MPLCISRSALDISVKGHSRESFSRCSLCTTPRLNGGPLIGQTGHIDKLSKGWKLLYHFATKHTRGLEHDERRVMRGKRGFHNGKRGPLGVSREWLPSRERDCRDCRSCASVEVSCGIGRWTRRLLARESMLRGIGRGAPRLLVGEIAVLGMALVGGRAAAFLVIRLRSGDAVDSVVVRDLWIVDPGVRCSYVKGAPLSISAFARSEASLPSDCVRGGRRGGRMTA